MKKIKVFFLLICGIVSVSIGFIGFFTVCYPIKHLDIIQKYSQKYDINSNLILGMINVESGFDINAVSKSNAMGLMQLKKSTAKEIANKLNIEFIEDKLFEVDYNIHMGCYYVRYLLDYYEQDLEKAICAYNAGLSNVNRWVSLQTQSKEWTNNIDFKETSNYLKKIRSNKKIYGVLLRFY